MSTKPLKAQAREMVISVHDYFTKERTTCGPLIPVSKVNARVAAALKINKNTVTKVLKEKYGLAGDEYNVLKTPKKKFVREKHVTDPDVFRSDAIRRHVYNYFLRGEIPSVKKMVISLKEAELYEGRDTSLRKILKKIGFCYKKCDSRKIIMDRTDVALWRCIFLRRLKDLNWGSIVFTGETWINDTFASLEGVSETKLPMGKLERLVLCHAGTVDGFVPNALMAYVTKKSGEKYDEMDAPTYQTWFETQLLPNIPPASIIMINDTPYHSVEADKPPNLASPKADIAAWLVRHNIPCSEELRKPELMHLVKLSKPSTPSYAIDQIAHRYGHRVIRVPTNHCIYNPIELIWAQAKSYMGEYSTEAGERYMDVVSLAKRSLQDIAAADWRAFIANTKQKVEEDWETYGLLESRMEELLLNVHDCSDSSGSDSDDGELL